MEFLQISVLVEMGYQMNSTNSDYLRYRGRCKEMSEALAAEKGYTLVRGWYNEPMWNTREQHWWCVDDQGNIHDPTRKQFPSGGIKEFYEEFTGVMPCEQCGKPMTEDMQYATDCRYPICSAQCYGRLVGLL